jgi:LytS/YehU family sensor histidine kinase
MQINPHFLFNAMNSISMLVRDRKQEEAVRTIAGLSDLLRHVLDDSADQEVPLRRELEFIERYLAIEQIRFPDRLKVKIDSPDNTMDALVPNLLLQPLVENAIRHGVSRSAAVTTVRISSRAADGILSLSVMDDGPGFSSGSPSEAGSGLGITNTRRRLEQLYGDGYTLEFQEKEPQGATVNISLPIHTVPVINGDGMR